ncbi:GNAT family N-acetyltransferase [Parvibium lacunae]|uniref:GNAT family N-acetyltransferase n=1 Tax=Parvibium lacunae TaxID=1888893 RepID=A0A368L0H7_9BURK|nr:GNAT family N-acetyltransferase [Parvibium lacunae]RCS57063.1 GNAT family N-acetyltransferase [Parvibium lacunae]
MKFDTLSARELDPSLLQQWQALLGSRPCYNRPYYQPAWYQLLATLRPDTRLTLAYAENTLCGLWPHQAQHHHFNPGLAAPLDDYQGPIYSPHTHIDPAQWLAASGKRYWRFRHVPAAFQEFQAHRWQDTYTQWMDLEGGYNAYCARLSSAYNGAKARIIKDAETQERKIRRAYEHVEFQFDNRDPSDFQHMLAGKSRQYLETLGPGHDIFAVPWIREVFERLFHTTADAPFRGYFGSLKVDGQLIAGSFGIAAGGVLQFNLLWYEPEFARYSPGTQLLHGCALAAASHGFHTLELGGGDYDYKARFRTHTMPTFSGAVSRPAALAQAHHRLLKARWAIRDSAWVKRLRHG